MLIIPTIASDPKYIKSNWERIKKEMDEFYNRTSLNTDFKRDWLIYAYHKWGKSDKAIAALLQFEYKFGEISAFALKKTIQRLKERIAQIEEGTQK